MPIAYELRATLQNNGSAHIVGWYATEEEAQAALTLALEQGPWVQPAEIAAIETPDLFSGKTTRPAG